MSFTPRKVLVTGGAGFIGSNFIRYLLSKDLRVEVCNLDNVSYAGNESNLKNLPDPSRYEFVRGDICDRKLVDSLLRDHTIDTIIHFAAESHVDRSITGPAAFVQSNLVGTFVLLEAARSYWLEIEKWGQQQCRFHHISTDEVYGSLLKEAAPFTEKTAYAPNSPYSASKAGSDHMVRAYFHTYGLPVTTSNCSNNYGPYQHGEKFIPTVIRSCLNQKPIPVYGDGSNIRDWLHVSDHCSAIDQIIRAGVLGETYNIGGDHECSNIEIAKSICALMDQKKPAKQSYENLIQFVGDRPGHDWRYAINSEKLKMYLGWEPSIDFKIGLDKTIDWYVSNADYLKI